MPYVDRKTREKLWYGDHTPVAKNVGELTALLTGTVASYLDERLVSPKGLRYADLARVLGALEGCKADFIDRILLPYERGKRAENGDVWDRAVIDFVEGPR